MAIIVKKFGGSSVATPEKIMAVAERVVREKKVEDKVVVVVSAMGDTTDELIDLMDAITDKPSRRELDMLLSTGEQISIALLSMAFNKLGCAAISLTGSQAGIKTNHAFSKARIVGMEPKRLLSELERHDVVVVAGFQGITSDGDITTLGRGGSDTTAVAVAGAIKADSCEIFTDVDAIYSTDPRVVKSARRMREVTYNEMLEMARLGAVVMQPRAVEMGCLYNVPIHVRSTFVEATGTIIRGEYTLMEEREQIIRGVAHDTNVVKLAAIGVPDRPGVAYKLFGSLADANIDVDVIVQSMRPSDKDTQDIMFTVTKSDKVAAMDILVRVSDEIGIQRIECHDNVAKVSVVGLGMYGRPGIAANMFGALAEAGVNIDAISTSEISLSCLVQEDQAENAVKAIHERFFAVDEAESR